MTTVSENNASGGIIDSKILTSLWKLGFKLVPLSHNHTPGVKWTPIYDDIDYWREDNFSNLQIQAKFTNVASTFGKIHLRDPQNRLLFIQVLDVDSEAGNAVFMAMAKPYNYNAIPYLIVFDKDGNEFDHLVGADPHTLTQMVEKVLQQS